MSAAIRHTQKRPVAAGAIDRRDPTRRAIAVTFDGDTFDAIRARAIREGTSFGEQVRTLVEWGLEAAAGEGTRQ
jgi:hypothetical protein